MHVHTDQWLLGFAAICIATTTNASQLMAGLDSDKPIVIYKNRKFNIK